MDRFVALPSLGAPVILADVSSGSLTRRGALLAVVAFCLCLTGCQTYITSKALFRKVITTDYQGNVISEWVTVGFFHKIEGGWEFTTVEKQKPEPFPYEGRYVIGRRVRVIAPHFIIFRIPPPDWISGREVIVRGEATVVEYGK